MFKKNPSKNGVPKGFRGRAGFSLIEILIALTLLAVLSGTMFHAFTSVTPVSPTNDSKEYNIARQDLEGLHEAVRDDWWQLDSKPLSPNFPGPQPADVNLDGVNYSSSYTVTPVDVDRDGKEDYRKVVVVVAP